MEGHYVAGGDRGRLVALLRAFSRSSKDFFQDARLLRIVPYRNCSKTVVSGGRTNSAVT